MSIIIEDGGNTDYISVLLFGLFYKGNDDILSIEPLDRNVIYLQSLIKIKFVDEIRDDKCVFGSVLNEIRNYLVLECGYDIDIYEKQDIIKLWEFLSKKIPIKQKIINIFLEENNNNKNFYFDEKTKDGLIIFTINRKNDEELDIWNVLDDWICQTIICKNNNDYYCLIRDKKKWFKFSDKNIPCVNEIQLKNFECAIKKECVMVIYKKIGCIY